MRAPARTRPPASYAACIQPNNHHGSHGFYACQLRNNTLTRPFALCFHTLQVKADLAARRAVDPSGAIVRLTTYCPWKEHLHVLEAEEGEPPASSWPCCRPACACSLQMHPEKKKGVALLTAPCVIPFCPRRRRR
jgi:uncharacterized UPF0160 family protein